MQRTENRPPKTPFPALLDRETENRRGETTPVLQELPYWSFLEEAWVSVDGHLHQAIELGGVDANPLDDDRLEAIGEGLHRVLQGLAEGVVLNVIADFREDYNDLNIFDEFLGFVPESGGISRWLAERKIDRLRHRKGLLRSRIWIDLSRPILERKQGFGKILGQAISSEDHGRAVRMLDRDLRNTSAALKSAGFEVRRLSMEEIWTDAYEWLNPSRKATISAPALWGEEGRHRTPGAGFLTARSRLPFTDLHRYRGFGKVGNRLTRAITLSILPDFTDVAAVAHLLSGASGQGEAFPYRVSYRVRVLGQAQERARLKAKEMRKGALAALAPRRDISAEVGQEEIQGIMEELVRSGVRLMEVSLSVHVSGANYDELERRSDAILLAFKEMNQCEGLVEEMGQVPLFLSALPGNGQACFRTHTVTSANAADLLPVFERWKGTRKARNLFLSDIQTLIKFDPFDESLQAYNGIVIGSTGSGKSFTTNYLLQSFIAQGNEIVILDVGGSYRKFVELFGGEYRELDVNQPLNPFFRREDMIVGSGQVHDQKVQFLTGIIELMITEKGRGDTGILSVERALIDQVIRRTYLESTERPTLGVIQARLAAYGTSTEDLESAVLARSIAKRLGVWCEGAYARILNQKDSIEPKAKLVAFDLKGLEGQLQAVVLAILAGITWNRIQKNDGQKLIIFDEVWTLLSEPSTARFIEELYRTARKYNCGILSVSQSLNDFVSSPASAAILTNSIVRYILRITDGFDLIQEKFGLNDREMFLIRRLRREKGKFSELFLCFGDRRAVIRVEPSPEEYWVCTTHGEDRRLSQKVEAAHPDWSAKELLEHLAKEHPYGA